jgi:hypothetical protein
LWRNRQYTFRSFSYEHCLRLSSLFSITSQFRFVVKYIMVKNLTLKVFDATDKL